MKVAIVFHEMQSLPCENIKIAVRTVTTYDLNVDIFLVTEDKEILKGIKENLLIRLNTTVISNIEELPKEYNATLRVGYEAELSDTLLYDKIVEMMSWPDKVHREITII